MAGDTPKGPIMWEMWWSIGGAVQLFQAPAQQGLEGRRPRQTRGGEEPQHIRTRVAACQILNPNS